MPDWKQFVRERLKLPKLTPSREAEIVEDVAGQLEEAFREALRRGATEAEARAAAEQHVPDWSALGAEIERNEQRHESTWAARAEEHFVTPRTFTGRGMEMLSDFVSDSIQALRALRKNPSFAIAAVLTLAIGIGANVSIFSVAETIVFRPLPFPAPDQLVVIWNEYEGHPAGSAPPDYMDRVHMSHTMQSIAAFEFRQADLTGRGEPVRLAVMRATASYFEVLQTKPLLGRVYSAEEDRPGAPPVVVLSHEIWQSRFGADRNIIGQSLTLSGVPRTVIGVMPPQIRLVDDVEAWVPSAFSPAQLSDAFRGNENQIVIGRMKNGVTLAQATADMKAIAASVLTRVPGRKDFLTRTHWSASVVPLKQQMVGDTQPAVLTVYAAVMLLLLMACVNVANLLLARATARRREISTRIALGASPARLARLLLTESLILAVTGGIAGLALTMAAIRVIAAAQITSVPRLGELTLHWGTLVYTAFIVLATALLFGVAPIRQMLRLNLAQGLQDRSNPSGRGRRQWTNRVLVAAQLAMALMVLIGAGLLLRTFQNLSRTSPGFSAENRVTFRVAMPRVRYPDAAHQIVFVQQLSERLKTLPGVRSVGFTHRLPLIGINDTATVHIQGVELPPGVPPPGVELRTVDPGYLAAMGIPLLEGRNFDERDQEKSTPVALIDAGLAQSQWRGQSPIGKRFSFGDENWIEVAGVVGTVKNEGLDAGSQGQVYLPQTQNTQSQLYAVLSVATESGNWRNTIAAAVHSLDPAMPIDDVKTMEQRVALSIAPRKHVSTLLGVFGAVGLLLAAFGLYGLISYLAGQRTREFAVRLALGAQRQDVMRLVLGQGALLVAAGLGIGVTAALGLTRVIQQQLFGVEPTDWRVFLASMVILAAIALAATVVPARRATRVDPIVALRSE